MIPNLKEFYSQVSAISEFANLNWTRCVDRFQMPIDFQIELNTNETIFDDFLEMLVAFSCLLQADRGSFSEFEDVKFDLVIDTSSQKKDSKLAKIRTNFQNQILANFDNNEPIKIIHAPTGIGKTKVFLDLVSRYKNDITIERIFYFSPLLALTDDFEKKLEESIPNKDELEQVLTYNHIFAGSIEEKKKFEDGKRELTGWSFPIESFNKKFVVTTTQRLLMTLYSNKQRENLKLASFRNSILIIDEVQLIPKFILANLKEFLLKLNHYMGTRTILVSATIPHEISDIKKVEVNKAIIKDYLNMTKKTIEVTENLDLNEIKVNRTLIMANTRKKSANLFYKIKTIHKDTNLLYLSTGIRKKDRKNILDEIANSDNFVLISTQVVEAGVDVSFTNIYREIAPLDSIIQVMGRLNREGKEPNANLVVYEYDGNNRPYSELEFNESLKRIKTINNSLKLYEVLSDYYKTITSRNKKNANLVKELEDHIKNMDFDKVWDFVNRHVFLDDEKDTVFVPDFEQWDEVKYALMKRLPKESYKKYGLLTASLPSGAQLRDDYFDSELLEKNILLPKKERLNEIYDEKLGLDKWLVTN
jgi:CRISPR-associated helicase Cas3